GDRRRSVDGDRSRRPRRSDAAGASCRQDGAPAPGRRADHRAMPRRRGRGRRAQRNQATTPATADVPVGRRLPRVPRTHRRVGARHRRAIRIPMNDTATRTEHDLLGELEVPAYAYYGVHTLRAIQNFPITGTPISIYPDLVRALAAIKQAAAQANQ